MKSFMEFGPHVSPKSGRHTVSISKTKIILRTVAEMRLKLFFKNDIVLDITVKPDWNL